jgi:hypothetical protein
MLIPLRRKMRKGRMVADPVTGLPVLSAGKNAPVLTSREVAEMLAGFAQPRI